VDPGAMAGQVVTVAWRAQAGKTTGALT
jgi:hypothetical protein